MRTALGSWLLVLALGPAGFSLGESRAAQTRGVPQDLRSEQEHLYLLSQYIYPRADPFAARPRPEAKDLSKSFAKFTTEDSPEKVIAWYAGELGMGPGMATDGLFEIGGDFNKKLWDRSIADVRAFVHDYRVVEKAGGVARPGVVWEATAEVRASGGPMYVLTALVTRGADESRTHIALSWFEV